MSGLSVIFRRASSGAFVPAVWTDKNVWDEYSSMNTVLKSGFSGAGGQYSTPSGGQISVSMEGELWAPDFVYMSIDEETDRIHGEIAYAFAAYHHHAVERYEVATENGMFGEHTTITVYVKD